MPVEVEGLLVAQIAQRVATERSKTRADQITVYENPDGEAAPPWVDDLPMEAG